MRLIFLDTGTLGMVANPRGSPRAVQCPQWARNLLASGARVFVPEICDYEERRKLIHAGSTAGLARLDRLKIGFDYAPITTDVMLKAAELWAAARRAGLPTASAGCAGRGRDLGCPGDLVRGTGRHRNGGH